MQIPISYAFRCKPSEKYLLTEGSVLHTNRPQVCVLEKREISPSFLNEYCILDSTKAYEKLYLTKYGQEIFASTNVSEPTFVAKVDTQIEFSCSEEVFEAIHNVALPAIHPNVSVSYFEDESTGFLTMLRVYRIDRSISDELLQKGRMGSAIIIHLYDENENYTTEFVELGDPVISDGMFDYIRDEIIHTLRSKGALIGVYNNDERGRSMLRELGDMRRSMQSKREREFDPNSSEDRAKIDYDHLYKEIGKTWPCMLGIIRYISGIKPAQFGEIPLLVDGALRNDRTAIDRLVDVHMRAVLRTSMQYARLYGCDIEELFQEGICGLIAAIPRYNEQPNTTFSAYASFWVKQSMQRNVILNYGDLYVPVHVMERLLKVKPAIETHYCAECHGNIWNCSNLLSTVAELGECNIETAKTLITLSQPMLHLEDIENLDDSGQIKLPAYYDSFQTVMPTPFSDENECINEIIDTISQNTLADVVQNAFSKLRDKEVMVLRLRFGFECKQHTLGEIGDLMGVTRERIRQIEAKALRRLGSPNSHLSRYARKTYKYAASAKGTNQKEKAKEKVDISILNAIMEVPQSEDKTQITRNNPTENGKALEKIKEYLELQQVFCWSRKDAPNSLFALQSAHADLALHALESEFDVRVIKVQAGWEIKPKDNNE